MLLLALESINQLKVFKEEFHVKSKFEFVCFFNHLKIIKQSYWLDNPCIIQSTGDITQIS